MRFVGAALRHADTLVFAKTPGFAKFPRRVVRVSKQLR
jgi:hypothetical protein